VRTPALHKARYNPIIRPFLAVLILVAAPLAAQELHSRRTADLDLVYYDKAHEYLSYHLARSFENSLAFHEKLFDYKPSQPVVILMQDFGDFGHGGTSTVPWNYISIGIEPFDQIYDVMPANERMNWLMHHELVHVVATDKASDEDQRYRDFFHGKVAPVKEQPLSMVYSYLTSPRWYSPRWYHEGIAVFLETWMAGGIGRVLGGYDEMAFRTMVLDNAYFFDVVGLESEGTTIDFQVGQNSYLYGTRFVTWVAATYGPEKLIQWFNRTNGSKRYFKSQFQNVFGIGLDEAWQKWIASERDWQQHNLQKIRAYPVTHQDPVTHEILGSVSRSFYDADRGLLYAAVNRPAKPAQIVAIDAKSGHITPLSDVVAPALYFVTSLAYDEKGRKIFFTTNNSRGWRDLNELDLSSGQKRQLIKNCRTGDLVVNPVDQSVWGVQHHNGLSTVVRIPPPYTTWKEVMRLDYGRDIYDLDISPDGKSLSAALIDITGRQQLIKLNVEHMLTGDSAYEVLHEFENNSPSNFVFSADGRYLYGSSYYTGVSNLFRYDLQTKKVEALTNVESGLFRPIPITADSMIAYQYTSKGFTPVRVPIKPTEDVNAIDYLGQQVVEKYPVVKTWNAGSPARVNLDEVTTYAGPYKPIARLRTTSIYPVLEGYKSTVAAGVRFNISDPLGLDSFDITAALSNAKNNDEKIHLRAEYFGSPWRASLKYNATDFYDLFGPTKVSRKGYSAMGAYHQFLLYEKPRTLEYTIEAAYYGGLDTLPDFQNIPAPYEKYGTVEGHLDFADMRKTLGGIDDEYGRAWTLTAAGDVVPGDFFTRIRGTYDRGVLLPIEHSSLWVHTAAGKSFGPRDNAFANFYFGAFGNNWIDYQDVRRYREYYSFPGVDLNEIAGNDFAKAGLEWTLPALKFRRLGVPSLYTNWARLALFSNALVTDVASSNFRRDVYDLGAQVDLSLVMFSNLESMFSVGYAVAHEHGHDSNEVMISLRLLR
jgi:hypothetical protein